MTTYDLPAFNTARPVYTAFGYIYHILETTSNISSDEHFNKRTFRLSSFLISLSAFGGNLNKMKSIGKASIQP